MSSAQDRAKALAAEIKKAVQVAKAAEARVKDLGEQMMQALAEAKAEAERARTIVEYPSGRYECRSCGHSVLFTESTRDLPVCDNCGGRTYKGHEPKVTKIKPPPKKKYPAGMYECAGCGARTAIAIDTDNLSPCDLCGTTKLKALRF